MPSCPLLLCIPEDMKVTMLLVGLLGLFIAPGFANYNINVNDQGNVAGSGQQSVNIDNSHNVANVDNNNGWDSWNSLWDYENGFAATRLFSKKSCIVHKMNSDVMPSLQTLDALVKEKKLQVQGPGGPPPKVLKFSVSSNQVDDLTKYGQNIVGMCHGLPTYLAEEIPGAMYSEKCYSLNILWILNISLCGSTLQSEFKK